MDPFQAEKAKTLEREKHTCLGDVLNRVSLWWWEQAGGRCEAAVGEASLCFVPDSSVGGKEEDTGA